MLKSMFDCRKKEPKFGGQDEPQQDQNNCGEQGPPPPTNIDVIGNRIYFYKDVQFETINNFNRTLHDIQSRMRMVKIELEFTEPKIEIHIHSFGGSLLAGLAAMDAIESYKEYLTITTHIEGAAASAATLMSIAGTRRYMTPHSYMLIHQLSTVFWGTYENFKDNQQSLDKMMETLMSIYRKKAKMPEKVMRHLLKRDLWLNAQESLKYGLIDEIKCK